MTLQDSFVFTWFLAKPAFSFFFFDVKLIAVRCYRVTLFVAKHFSFTTVYHRTPTRIYGFPSPSQCDSILFCSFCKRNGEIPLWLTWMIRRRLLVFTIFWFNLLDYISFIEYRLFRFFDVFDLIEWNSFHLILSFSRSINTHIHKIHIYILTCTKYRCSLFRQHENQVRREERNGNHVRTVIIRKYMCVHCGALTAPRKDFTVSISSICYVRSLSFVPSPKSNRALKRQIKKTNKQTIWNDKNNRMLWNGTSIEMHSETFVLCNYIKLEPCRISLHTCIMRIDGIDEINVIYFYFVNSLSYKLNMFIHLYINQISYF